MMDISRLYAALKQRLSCHLQNHHSSHLIDCSNMSTREFAPSQQQVFPSDEATSSSSSSSRGFSSSSIQRFSLDAAVSPLLQRPTAPFDRTERKRAHTSALFYSECFLRGIQPLDADTAAQNAQQQYDKWWVKKTAARHQESNQQNTGTTTKEGEPDSKRRKVASSDDDNNNDNSSDGIPPLLTTTPQIISPDDVGDDSISSREPPQQQQQQHQPENVGFAKTRLIEDLKSSGGDIHTRTFLDCMSILESDYKSKSLDGRGMNAPFSLGGNWLTLSKPTYDECKGRNSKGELTYSLGRMSFGMFRPTNLVCSVQASFNNVQTIDPRNPPRPLHVPSKLMKDIQSGIVNLRTYDIVTAFTIEADQDRSGNSPPKESSSSSSSSSSASSSAPPEDNTTSCYIVPKPIRGILTNQGYAIPDPQVENRLSIWFSGGSLEVLDETTDLEEWKNVFDADFAPDRNLREHANILAARLLLGVVLPDGMEEDGTMSFALKKPIGGHGSAYCDIVYMDEDLRIMRGHHGAVYVCTRVAEPEHIIVVDEQ